MKSRIPAPGRARPRTGGRQPSDGGPVSTRRSGVRRVSSSATTASRATSSTEYPVSRSGWPRSRAGRSRRRRPASADGVGGNRGELESMIGDGSRGAAWRSSLLQYDGLLGGDRRPRKVRADPGFRPWCGERFGSLDEGADRFRDRRDSLNGTSVPAPVRARPSRRDTASRSQRTRREWRRSTLRRRSAPGCGTA